MNTILDQGILGHPASPRTYWASDVNVTPMRAAPPLRSRSRGDFAKSVGALWNALTKG
jgi:hypothetical protein